MHDALTTRRVLLLDAHHRLIIAVILAAATFFLLQAWAAAASRIIAAWDVFVLVDLSLAWRVIFRADPAHLRETTRLQDSSQTALFTMVVLAACAAFASVAFILGPSKRMEGVGFGLHLVLSVIAVVGAWMVVHTVFALRYAHLYYARHENADRSFRKGLEFPGTARPEYMDFAYFSFVIGMTSQVSDVQVTGKELRRLTLAHGILSFFFNVVILGLTISVMSGLI